MASKTPDLPLNSKSLSYEGLQKLKWSTVIAIVGLPIVAQILGAMMLFSPDVPVLSSLPAILVFLVLSGIVMVAGVYALTTRLFLRFSGANSGLHEWEAKVQSDAYTFSYRVIVRGALIAFLGVSILGALQLLNLLGWIEFEFGQSIVLNMPAIATLTVVLTYLVLLLPTLFIAWTVKPLSDDD